ncbi:hypothetical protein C8J27_103344 [Rhodobacter aestuarii]|uniref:Uncharacterized protein n=1 Tax=Rhodobacter aestuarii TaxID=453582 RepID=A0A1N7JRX7_9RHOB|nr:hypothetical protein C8J27_103344 [Rhodobacter aestuarii]SIS52093.1 hypothetical protein SAMN05421580_10291 [Rhodobacter aestuarii]
MDAFAFAPIIFPVSCTILSETGGALAASIPFPTQEANPTCANRAMTRSSS